METRNESQEEFGRSLRNLGRKPSTVHHHQRTLNRLFDFLAEGTGTPADDICLRSLIPLRMYEGGPIIAHGPVDADVVESFLAHCTDEILDQAARARKRNQTLQTFRLFFGDQVRRGTLAYNPALLIRRARVPHKVPGRKYLTREERERLIAAAVVSGPDSERNYALIMTMLCSGIRPGEARSLTPRDLDFCRQRFTVTGKTGRRTALMVDDLMAVLQKYLDSPYYTKLSQGRSDLPLFPNSASGEPLTANELRLLVRELAEQAKIGIRVIPYTLRHTFATLAYDDGVPFGVVARVMGHKRLQTSFFYVHTWQKRLWKIAEENAATGPLDRAFTMLEQRGIWHQLHFDFSLVL
jgi:site-specific recombinase XerD